MKKPSRAERRRLEKAARTGQSLNDSRKGFFGLIGRFGRVVSRNPKKSLAIALSLALIGGTVHKFGLIRIPWLENAVSQSSVLKKKPKLFFGFTRHNLEGANFFHRLALEAEQRGQSFNVVLIEAAEVTKQKRAVFEERLTRLIPQWHAYYTELLRTHSREESERLLLERIGRASDPPEALLYAAQKNLPVKLVEEYSEEESQRIHELYDKSNRVAAQARNARTLSEGAQFFLESLKVIAEMESIRNNRIVEHIPRALKELIKTHPELNEEGINALIYLGLTHAGVSARLGEKEAEVSRTLFETPAFYNLAERLIANPGGSLNLLDVKKLLVNDIVSNLIGNLHKAGPAMWPTIRNYEREIERLTEKDFEELERKTTGMSREQRELIIWNYLSLRIRERQ